MIDTPFQQILLDQRLREENDCFLFNFYRFGKMRFVIVSHTKRDVGVIMTTMYLEFWTVFSHSCIQRELFSGINSCSRASFRFSYRLNRLTCNARNVSDCLNNILDAISCFGMFVEIYIAGWSYKCDSIQSRMPKWNL